MNEHVIDQGDDGDNFYVVDRSEGAVTREWEGGREEGREGERE